MFLVARKLCMRHIAKGAVRLVRSPGQRQLCEQASAAAEAKRAFHMPGIHSGTVAEIGCNDSDQVGASASERTSQIVGLISSYSESVSLPRILCLK